MSILILNSNLEFYHKDENGNRVGNVLVNNNDIIQTLKRYIKKYDNFLYVASVEDNPIATDMYAKAIISGVKLTFPFKNFNILDGRNALDAQRLIKEADLILLAGGHLPSQNKFFNNVNLRKFIENTDAVICGMSAGSMNCADVVYCPPELDGEAIDSNFKRYLKGLGITNINILPHYNSRKDFIVDDKRYIKDIIIPDSYKTKMLILNDGSYVVQIDNITKVYGEAYILYKGEFNKICGNSKSINIDRL